MLKLVCTFTSMYGSNSSYFKVQVLRYGVYMWFKFCVLIMKANEMHNFSCLFDKVLYMFRTSPPSIIRSISTLYTRNRYLSC